jgi:hypothetical protein
LAQNYLQKQRDKKSSNLFFARIKEDKIYISGIEIANKDVANKERMTQYAILELFIDQLFNSYITNRTTNDLLNINTLMNILETRYNITINHEAQIRRSIKIIRENIFKKLGTTDVIETVLWKGYRLNPIYVKLG